MKNEQIDTDKKARENTALYFSNEGIAETYNKQQHKNSNLYF